MHGGYLSFDERREPGTAATPNRSNAPKSVHRVLRRHPLVEVHTTSWLVFGANPGARPARSAQLFIPHPAFELVVMGRLVAKLEFTLARPKLRRHFDEAEVSGFLELIRRLAETVENPDTEPRITSRDPRDEYLIAAAASARAT